MGAKISPDGLRVAFYDESAEGIFTVPLEGGPRRLVVKPVAGPNLAWSPDGRSIAFVSRKDEAVNVSVVPAIGGTSRRFDASQPDPLVSELAWCSGSIVIYTHQRSLRMLDLETLDDRRFIDEDYTIGGPRCSPDGKQLAYGGNEFAVLSLVSRHRTLLSKRYLSPIGWSSDGRWVYAREGGSSEIVRVPAGGGPAESVAELPFDPVLIRPVPDLHFDGEHFVVAVADPRGDIWLLENFDRLNR